jgi:galactose oxidase-like protein
VPLDPNNPPVLIILLKTAFASAAAQMQSVFGGESVLTKKPGYQFGLGVPTTPNRDIPDIAMVRGLDTTASGKLGPGVFIGNEDPFNSGTAALECCSGGTSLGAPIWAGLSKLISQKTGTRLENINPQVYLFGSIGNTIGFRDVVLSNNGFNGVQGFNAGIGYDQATGWGTPDFPTFTNSQLFVSIYFLICGGCTDNECGMGHAWNTCERYNPTNGNNTQTGSMQYARGFFPSVLLADGTTLVTGGETNILGTVFALYETEIFNPASGTFSQAADMKKPRERHTGTRLHDGRVLITGGSSTSSGTVLKSAEIYDPTQGTFTLLSSTMSSVRFKHSATLLNSGKVLVAGGSNGSSSPSGPLAPLATADLFDPATNAFSAVGGLNTARVDHAATLLPGGKVLITGGNDACVTLSSAELFDPSANTFTTIGNMTRARGEHTATLLPNGQVLIAGGFVNSGCGSATALSSAELFDPASNSFTALSSTMSAARFDHSASVLTNGNVLVAGGFGANPTQ